MDESSEWSNGSECLVGSECAGINQPGADVKYGERRRECSVYGVGDGSQLSEHPCTDGDGECQSDPRCVGHSGEPDDMQWKHDRDSVK